MTASYLTEATLARVIKTKGWRIVPSVSKKTGRQRWAIFYNGNRMWTKTALVSATAYVYKHRK